MMKVRWCQGIIAEAKTSFLKSYGVEIWLWRGVNKLLVTCNDLGCLLGPPPYDPVLCSSSALLLSCSFYLLVIIFLIFSSLPKTFLSQCHSFPFSLASHSIVVSLLSSLSLLVSHSPNLVYWLPVCSKPNFVFYIGVTWSFRWLVVWPLHQQLLIYIFWS